MELSQVKDQLSIWLQDFVEKPHPALGNWAPCPFARSARINNQIEIIFSNAKDLYTDAIDNLPLLDHKEVVIICFDHNMIDPVTLQETVGYINQRLMPVNYVALEDHPGAPEYINGVQMNFGICGLLLVQKLDKLNTASTQLKEKGYYTHWNQKAMNDVVNWRNQ